MKPTGNTLCFERSENDRAAARLLRRVLGNRPRNMYGSDSVELKDKIEGWLGENASQEALPLTVEEVIVCAEIIRSQVEIAEETPGMNDSRGTARPHNISQAKVLLPGMEEFIEKQNGK